MYDLHSLGWHSFQQLCLTVAREIFGQAVESFLPSADAGRDGAFTGRWKRKAGEELSGRFVIQCKFTCKRDKNLNAGELAGEAKKAKRLVERGLCDSYVLMTNAGVSGAVAAEVAALFRGAGARHVAVFGSTWLCEQIREYKRLRMMVPRVYGLGDLSQILDERAYAQAKALLASLRDDLAKVVITSAYRRAAEALDRHGFVLLIGEPAAGKTTIASMLAVAALDQWGCSTLKLDDPGSVIEHWNPDEPAQFFWVDDAFGVQQYESYLVHRWNHALAQMKAMLRQGTKVVMTSRDYIYRRARNELKEGAFPLLRESQVVIDVRDLSREEREQILYNHLKLGRQSRAFRRAIKPHLPFISQHRRFIPETARRLGDPLFTKNLDIERDELDRYVEKQEQLLREVIRGLDEHSRAALALIYMRNGVLESPMALEGPERDAIERMGSNLAGCGLALDCLNGSLVQHTQVEGVASWCFKHPTVGDALASLLVKNPEWLGIYLRGSAVENLLDQITCGDVGLERAVIVPKNLLPLVRSRLKEFESQRHSSRLSRDERRNRLDSFLSWRCSREFLTAYVQDESVLARVENPGLLLSASSEVRLAIRLHELGVLPEDARKKFLGAVTAYTFDGEDLHAVESGGIQGVFSEAERDEFWRRVRTELVPNLGSIRRDWEDWYESDRNPDDHMQPLLESMNALKERFADEPALRRDVEYEINSVEEWIGERMADYAPLPERAPRIFGGVNVGDEPPPHGRSIFDDIDQ